MIFLLNQILIYYCKFQRIAFTIKPVHSVMFVPFVSKEEKNVPRGKNLFQFVEAQI